MNRRFDQLDVFTDQALRGNPLAVVHAAEGLDDARMAAFARWMNLSETTFLLPPTDERADYRVRIFTPHRELPFAGHPTLGSCHAWLSAGGRARDAGVVVQQCGAGLVRVRRGPRLAFAAPPLLRSGPIDAATLERVVAALGLRDEAVRAHAWVDNGPGWCALLLDSARRVLALRPDWPRLTGLSVGVVGAHDAGHDAQFELRAFSGTGGYEDPVTGSLNASVAMWLIGAGLAPARYVAAQGAALQRAGRIYIDSDGDTVWVGGGVTSCIRGEVSL